MEAEKPSSKRAQHVRRPSKPPIRLAREKRSRQLGETTSSKPQKIKTTVENVRSTKNSVDISRRMQEDEAIPQSPSADEDPNARSYRVANVGAGGRLYLKPSRKAVQLAPLSLAGLDFQEKNDPATASSGHRQSVTTDTWSIREDPKEDHPIEIQTPLASVDGQKRRITRSNSFSGIGDRGHLRASIVRNSRRISSTHRPEKTTTLPKDVTDFSSGLLDLPIPHYRLGTPYFTEMGSAYMRGSMYSMSTAHDRSSMFSYRQKPFRQSQHEAATSRASLSTIKDLQPSFDRSALPLSHNNSAFPRTPTVVTPALYDKIERNPDDPAMVQYHPVTRTIVAATAGRLVAEITSPQFLDYELLSDFFLTFRSFMFTADLLEYLLARLRWALNKSDDAGRIVRVRTFVALRHWILNYFADDFLSNYGLRQRFCDIVDDITYSIRDSQERGRMKMSIVGELKKCWRRTCAAFWPIPDAMETSADAKIWPGGDLPPISIPQPISMDEDHDDSPLPFFQTKSAQEQAVAAVRGSINRVFRGDMTPLSMKHTSFPTSPMSEDSLHVLSCSVPFLRNVNPVPDTGVLQPARLPSQQKVQMLTEKPGRVSHQHKRSGSFTDALRDNRSRTSSGKAESMDLTELPAIAFTGGLIRGLLLRPISPEFNALTSMTPAADPPMVRFAEAENEPSLDKPTQAGVRKLVGEMRRALSTRHRPSEPAVRASRSAQSSSDIPATRHVRSESAPRPDAWQQLRSPVRVDLLGEKAAEAYELGTDDVPDPLERHDIPIPTNTFFYSLDEAMLGDHAQHAMPPLKRIDSNFTSRSQSIVIMDATGSGIVPRMSASAPELSMWSPNGRYMRSPTWRGDSRFFEGVEPEISDFHHFVNKDITTQMHGSRNTDSHHGLKIPRHRSDARKSSLGPDLNASQRIQARKSSSAYPNGVAISSLHHALRRRPGGDLRATDHVRELQTAAKRSTSGSYSINPSLRTEHPTNSVGMYVGNGEAANDKAIGSYHDSKTRDESFALLDTHSSVHGLRPSLEAQVSQLATLPDELGGVEDALLKLEGKSPIDSHFTDHTIDQTIPLLDRMKALHDIANASDTASYDEDGQPLQLSSRFILHADMQEPTDFRFPATSDMDILETDVRGRERSHSMPAAIPAFQIDDCGPASTASHTEPASQPLIEGLAALQTPTMTQRPVLTSRNISDVNKIDVRSQHSFLLDDSDSLSDISTALGDEVDDDRTNAGMGSFSFDDTVKAARPPRRNEMILPTPTLTASPASPTATEYRKMHSRSNTVGHASEFSGRSSNQAIHLPKLPSPNVDRNAWPMPPSSIKQAISIPQAALGKHLPFVLLFEPEVIAQQLTIIEKDALDEIDWQDLIGMKWRQHFPIIRNWASFLRFDDCSGVDLVVARFNLAVKWVISECVLTESVNERARAIKRFIRIARHCRRLRNYASMYQITLGLLSTEVTRLRRTWAIVGPADKRLLLDLEKLCQPVRNFRNLRAEMESGSPGEGCIPFIGLYTHDLMYNAQKPTRIDSPFARDEPLINFERFQTTAGIVKSLLRLIEASSKYTFQPHPEALSRCLWLAALEDREIASRSRTIEP